MKRLNLNPEPRWVEIDKELSVAVRPIGAFELGELVENQPALQRVSGGQAGGEAAETLSISELLDLVAEIAELAFTDWTVSDENGERLPVSGETARLLVRAEPGLAGPLIENVLMPAVRQAEELAAEKNGSAPSPNGSTAGAKTTAAAASGRARNAPDA